MIATSNSGDGFTSGPVYGGVSLPAEYEISRAEKESAGALTNDVPQAHARTIDFLKLIARVLTFGLIVYGSACLAALWLWPGALPRVSILVANAPYALLSVLAGVAFLCVPKRFESGTADLVIRIIGIIMVLFGVLTYGFFLGLLPVDVSTLGVRPVPGLDIPDSLGIRGVPYAIMLGTGLLLLDKRLGKILISGWLGIFICFLSFLACFTYFYQLTSLYVVTMPHRNLWLAVLFIRLSSGLLLVSARAEHPLFFLLTQSTAGGALARRLLSAAIAVPLILGILREVGQHLKLFGPDGALAALVISLVLVVFGLIWQTCLYLDELDSRRLKTAEALRETEEHAIAETTAANRELTEMAKQLAAARDEALESARTKSEFLANMSHEIRTPMATIVSGTKLLRTTELRAEQLDLVLAVTAAGQSLLNIIDNILTFSRLEAGKYHHEQTEFDLPHLVESTMRFFAPADGTLIIATHISPRLPQRVVGDPAALREVLSNLIANAVKFTHRGAITLRIEPAPGVQENMVRFSLFDTGVGIERQAIHRLFKPFVQIDSSITRRYGGSGLGLCISKRLVELMNGTIKVRSRIGAGSVFSFTIPLQKAQPPQVKNKVVNHDLDEGSTLA